MSTIYTTIVYMLAAAVSAGGTFTMPYPAGMSADDFAGGDNARLYSASRNPIMQKENGFSLGFTGSGVEVTLNANIGFNAGETVYLDVDIGNQRGGSGQVGSRNYLADPASMAVFSAVKINLGTPIASDGDAAVASQACTVAGGLATGINGALAADGVATFDVPRNVVAAWTGTAVLTVTGTDAYGMPISESSASGTSLTGKKAFKTVTGVSTSADITGLTVGNSKVLGLPAYLGDVLDVLAEVEDGAAATAGTIVVGDGQAATATTGDVRGTYAPNSNPNGTRAFSLLAMIRDPSGKGVPQYAA